MLRAARQPVRLGAFTVIRPRHDLEQDKSFAWLGRVHAQRVSADERDALAGRLASVMRRCGPGPTQIARRGLVLSTDELEHLAYAQTAERMDVFAREATATLRDFYVDDASPPDDLIHVTCTGYVSPSPAQHLVSERGWGARTRVTHAYHMGCYAALPALRIATGFGAQGSRRIDLVHTELCSLHIDPHDDSLAGLVVQNLFADGLIRYSLRHKGRGYDVLAQHDRIVPDSVGAMSWRLGDHGMTMTLARDVSERIGSELRAFVIDLYARAGLDVAAMRDSLFAVHPGGPKILDGVGATLELSAEQLTHSRAVLRDHGNMSSATLPHIWARVLHDATIPSGTLVPSLAFGPGLTICGALLVKRC